MASIALYPDDLLTQLLMASTFPLEVVAAARWVEDPTHKSLSGDALVKALEAEPWDPSVKSLVPFPVVLATLNSNLTWLQQLGYAFATQQADVFAAVQRLRRLAQANDKLQSSPQQVVSTQQVTVEPPAGSSQPPTQQEVIVIQPAQSDTVYVPSYDPAAVYGSSWPDPSYPPYYPAPPPGYYFGTALATGLAFAAGAAVVGGLWGWASPGWGGGYANVNVNRYNNINANRSQISSNRWGAGAGAGRPGNFARPPGGPVGPSRPFASLRTRAMRCGLRPAPAVWVARRVAAWVASAALVARGSRRRGRCRRPWSAGWSRRCGWCRRPWSARVVPGAWAVSAARGRPGGPGGAGGVGGAGRPAVGPGGVGRCRRRRSAGRPSEARAVSAALVGQAAWRCGRCGGAAAGRAAGGGQRAAGAQRPGARLVT